jgi:hypothetical protein
MQNRKGKYEKVLLSIAGLAALGVAGYLIWSSRTFNDRLVTTQVSLKNDPGQPPKAAVDAALKRLSEKVSWLSPVILNKPVPLNKSIRLLRKDGQLIDLLVETPVLRPPFPNAYLNQYDLPNIDSPNFGDLDPDGDGFTNLEEFNRKTNPMDVASKPPVTDKLFLKQRISHDYVIKLNSSSPPFQVQRVKPEPKVSKFVSPGDEFGFEKGVVRFKVVSFEEKKVPDPTLGEKDVSELTILDLASNKPFKVIRNSPDTNLAEYEAEFEFLLGKGETRKVKQGETFQIPGLGITYKVLEIEENKAVIAPVLPDLTTGPPLTVPKR